MVRISHSVNKRYLMVCYEYKTVTSVQHYFKTILSISRGEEFKSSNEVLNAIIRIQKMEKQRVYETQGYYWVRWHPKFSRVYSTPRDNSMGLTEERLVLCKTLLVKKRDKTTEKRNKTQFFISYQQNFCERLPAFFLRQVVIGHFWDLLFY